MTEEVVLLKHGTETHYFCCDACGRYARGISERGWCVFCELECAGIKKGWQAKQASTGLFHALERVMSLERAETEIAKAKAA